jgi:NDP-sugar pyrophosphorylase family protein
LIESFPKEQVFSVIKAYLKIAATEDIHGYVTNDLKWIDVGKVDSLERAELLIKNLK